MDLLTKKEAAERIGVHPESLMRMVRQGRFVKPVRYGEASTCPIRFVGEEIDAWLAERMAEREAG